MAPVLARLSLTRLLMIHLVKGAGVGHTPPDPVVPRLNLRQIADYRCGDCLHEWVAPWTDTAGQSGCPRCHSGWIVLKDGSVRTESAPRV